MPGQSNKAHLLGLALIAAVIILLPLSTTNGFYLEGDVFSWR
jgi:hypothetical protein